MIIAALLFYKLLCYFYAPETAGLVTKLRIAG